MFDLRSRDPFALASWRCNLIPVGDPDARLWWICSLVAHATGKPVFDELAMTLAEVPIASA